MARRVAPDPFAYPPGIHQRLHGPGGWTDYSRYRPWLRDEFCFRCVYCLIREQWVDMRRGYQIDHFLPQKLRPDLAADYDNLLYLCPSCNNLKGAELLPDPCAVALQHCLKFHADGSVEALDEKGELIVEVLELDDPRLVDLRRRKIGILSTLALHNWPQFVEEMRFPTDLPELRAIQPQPRRNARPEGVESSWFVKKQARTLPEVY